MEMTNLFVPNCTKKSAAEGSGSNESKLLFVLNVLLIPEVNGNGVGVT